MGERRGRERELDQWKATRAKACSANLANGAHAKDADDETAGVWKNKSGVSTPDGEMGGAEAITPPYLESGPMNPAIPHDGRRLRLDWRRGRSGG